MNQMDMCIEMKWIFLFSSFAWQTQPSTLRAVSVYHPWQTDRLVECKNFFYDLFHARMLALC